MYIGETLSSDTLFHFTSKREYLINIIENGFFPRYCTEDLSMFSDALSVNADSYEYAVPMVCFCDIPLSKVKEHISVYKGYGIGCTKAWGIGQGITPLVYVKPNSETVTNIQNAMYALKSITDVSLNDRISIQAIRDSIYRLLKFIKPYEGRFVHNGLIFENKRFYDEREWRYVPPLNDPQTEPSISWLSKDGLIYSIKLAEKMLNLKNQDLKLLGSEIQWAHSKLKELKKRKIEITDSLLNTFFDERRHYMSNHLESIPNIALPVDPLTIKYIIVEQEDDVVPIVDVLEKKFRDDYSATTLKRLITRIITLDQIRDDF